jgi:hypothetical protein
MKLIIIIITITTIILMIITIMIKMMNKTMKKMMKKICLCLLKLKLAAKRNKLLKNKVAACSLSPKKP